MSREASTCFFRLHFNQTKVNEFIEYGALFFLTIGNYIATFTMFVSKLKYRFWFRCNEAQPSVKLEF